MDSSLASTDLVRPWRTATLIASAIAAVELVALLVVGVALLAEPVAKDVTARAVVRAPAEPRPAALPPAGEPRLTRQETSVAVLNGNGRAGAAAEASARIVARGYAVVSVGNAARSDYDRTLVMYRRGYRPEAARFARDVGSRVVAPLDGVGTGAFSGAHVVVILGAS